MFKLFDRVQVDIATTGTGDVTFGSASTNAFLTPTEAGAADGDTTRYVIVDGTDYEEGIGTIASSVATMARTTVTKSKIGGTAGTTKLDLSGTAVLALVASAADILNPTNNLSDLADAPTALTNLGGTTVGKALFTATDAAAAQTAAGGSTVGKALFTATDAAAARTAAGVGTGAVASKSDQQTGTSAVTAVTPAHQQDHDSAAKAWVSFNAAGTVLASYNVASISKSGTGVFVVTFTTAFASANYACNVTGETGGAATIGYIPASKTTTTVSVAFTNAGGTLADPVIGHVVCFGQQ